MPNKMGGNYPSVSIIIPVYNDAERLDKCLTSIKSQSYSGEVSTYVIDNGSDDKIHDIVSKYNINYVFENTYQNPYICRNSGIKASEGEIIALIDATCTPDSDWLKEGVQFLSSNQIGIIGGAVRFELSDKPTVSEIIDSKGNLQMKNNINNRQVAKTANLFVKRHVFEQVGLFPEKWRSGGDVYWTQWASSSGFKIEYCPSATVSKPPRTLLPLLKKNYRVGKGKGYINYCDERSFVTIFSSGVSRMLSKGASKLSNKNNGSTSGNSYSVSLIYLLLFGITYVLISTIGKVSGYVQASLSNDKVCTLPSYNLE